MSQKDNRERQLLQEYFNVLQDLGKLTQRVDQVIQEETSAISDLRAETLLCRLQREKVEKFLEFIQDQLGIRVTELGESMLIGKKQSKPVQPKKKEKPIPKREASKEDLDNSLSTFKKEIVSTLLDVKAKKG